jgi:acyl-CoA thioester hydrolase
MPTQKQVLELPALLTMTIPPGWQDQNGHVNVQHYLTVYDRAGWPLLAQVGIDPSHFQDKRQGLFDLEHHIWYLAEMHVGDEISAHSRFLGRSEKRLHGLMFLVNTTRGQLASVLEYVSSGADLELRRTAALPDLVKERLDQLLAAHDALGWEPPRCGVMSA